MGNSFSLSVQSDLALTPYVNITTHTSGLLPSTVYPSILSKVLFDNGKPLGEPTLEVLKSLSTNGDKYTIIEVTTQPSAESVPSKAFGSGVEAISPSVQDGRLKAESTLTLRIQPRADELYEEAVFDSYEAPAKDRAAIEQQYIPPPIEEPADLSSVIIPPSAAVTDISSPEDQTATKTLPDKARTRGKPSQLTKIPTLVRIPHIPIQLFGRRHIRHVVELME